MERERERAPRRNPSPRAPPAEFSAADTWDDSLEWPRSPATPPPSYDRRESERDASPSGSGQQPPNDEEEFGARGERRESRYGAREDFGRDDWAAFEPRGAYDEWRGSRDGRSGPGWNPAESLPGVMGAATRAILAACSSMSDVTARALAGVFPRSVPMASLRTLAYLLWGFLFFVVFQRVISGFVLVGGLLLLAVAVAQGETSRGFGGSDGDPRDGRARGAAFGSRGSNFDEFRDRRARERRRRRAEDFFGAAAAAAGAAPMMEWWNERAEYERDFYGYPGGGGGDDDDDDDDFRGDDGYAYGFPDDRSGEARRRSYDSDGDFVDVTPPAIDWSKLADTVRRAAQAEEFRVVNDGINEGIKMANDAVRGFQGTFEGAGGAGEAGFSFSKEPVSAADDVHDDDDGIRSPDLKDDDDDDASGPSSGDPTVVDVEARAVPFDEWFSRGSTDASDRGFPLTSDDAAAGSPSSSPSSSSSSSSSPPPPPPPPREGRAAYRDSPSRWTAGTYRDPNASARGDDRADAGRREWGYGAFGRDAGAPPYGSDRGGAGRNRWREFMTGRFYGEFQEDLIAARFDVGGGVAVEEEEEEEEKRGATGRGANFDDDDDPGAGAVR